MKRLWIAISAGCFAVVVGCATRNADAAPAKIAAKGGRNVATQFGGDAAALQKQKEVADMMVAGPDFSKLTSGPVGPGVPDFWVRPGYRVDLAGQDYRQCRFLETDGKGAFYLSEPGVGIILSMRYVNGKLRTLGTFVRNHPTAHGMCWHDGWLWFTESQGVFKARDTDGDGKADEEVAILPSGSLPGGNGHWWRSIWVDDTGFYTSVGDAGNVSLPEGQSADREKIWRYNLDGSGKKLFCSGIRNTEKLRFRPGTKEVWGCDHGSDWWGSFAGDREGRQPVTDLNPPEEFNHYVEGGFYGHPLFVGDRLPRMDFMNKGIDMVAAAERTIPPAWKGPAHWANNGWDFYTLQGPALPADFAGDAFIAYHGSWNRQWKAGYRIEHIIFDKVTGLPCGSQPMVVMLKNNVPLGRPSDVVEASDGSLLFTDDTGRKIYRLSKVQ